MLVIPACVINQPPRARVAPLHPLSRGLLVDFQPWQDLTGWTLVGTPSRNVYSGGRHLPMSASCYAHRDDADLAAITDQCTWFADGVFVSGVGFVWANAQIADSGYNAGIYIATGNKPTAYIRNASGTVASAAPATLTLTAGAPVALHATYDGALIRLYKDGVLIATQAQTGNVSQSSGDKITACRWNFGSVNFAIRSARVWSRVLSDFEIAAHAARPGMAFTATKRMLYFDVGAGAPGGALSASGSAAASGTASLAAGIALAGVGVALAGGSADAAVAIPLSAAGIASAAGSATGAIAVTLSASALATAAGQAGLDVAAALAAAGSAQAGGSATLSGGAEGAISASGAAQAGGAAVLSILVTLAAAGTAQAGGSATLSGGPEGALSASGAAQAGGSATATVAIALTAAGLAQAIGSGQLTLSIPLSAIGFATSGGTATLIDINLVRVLAAPRAARPPRVQSGRRAPNLSASRRSWR